MKIKQKDWRQLSQLFMGASLVAVVISAFGYAGQDILFASTQWLLVAVALAIFGVYARMNS